MATQNSNRDIRPISGARDERATASARLDAEDATDALLRKAAALADLVALGARGIDDGAMADGSLHTVADMLGDLLIEAKRSVDLEREHR